MSEKVFDYQAAMTRVDQDTELFQELVAIFFEEYAEELIKIESGLAGEEAQTVEARAHSIKSALGNIGAMQASACAAMLEKTARAGCLAGLPPLFSQLKSEVEKFRAEYRKLNFN